MTAMRVRTLTVRRAQIAVVIACAGALAAATPGAGAPSNPRIRAKQAEARRVLAQVNTLDIQLGRVNEQLNGAIYQLNKVKARERYTARLLKVALKQYKIAIDDVSKRLIALYEEPPPSSTDAVLGASSFSAMLDRLELVNAGNRLDRQVANEAKLRRNLLNERERQLVVERQQKAAAAAAIAAHRRTLDTEVAQRQHLLAGIQSEVAHLQAVERARQERLAAEARARLARERAAAAAAAALAEAAAKAAQSAHASSSTSTSSSTTTTTTSTTGSAPPSTTPATTGSTLPAPTNAGYPTAAALALNYIGIPYVFGGSSTDGFDCSGLVMYVYAQLGIQLPHFAAAQYTYGQPVPFADLQPGDLVFFDALDHVGIYIGNGQFVDAPHTGTFVRIDTFTGWYASTYVGARRL
jgi:cell wall-associated NlpC family hydrolase